MKCYRFAPSVADGAPQRERAVEILHGPLKLAELYAVRRHVVERYRLQLLIPDQRQRLPEVFQGFLWLPRRPVLRADVIERERFDLAVSCRPRKRQRPTVVLQR